LIWVAALIPIPLLFGSYEIKEGEKANSPSVIADGRQFRADSLTASIVLFALVGQRSGLPLDQIAAAAISLLIIRSGWEILVSGMRVLLDASIDTKTLEKIRSLIMDEPAVSKITEVIARNSGRFLFVEASISLKVLDLDRAHQISRRIEEKIRSKIPNVDRVLIHYEPHRKERLKYALPLEDLDGRISQHFGEAPYFALLDINLKDLMLEKHELIANPHKDLAKGRGLKVAEFLLKYKPDFVLAREDLSEKGPGYALAEAGVETIQTDAHSQIELVDQLMASLREKRMDGKVGTI
jgi:predicted Fe-Mo cluster-binding NifX family protein